MASPFQVTTLASVKGIDYSPQNRILVLGDGTVLMAAQSAVATTSLYQILSPGPSAGQAAPAITTLSQTFAQANSTDCVVSMWRAPGVTPGTDDVWVVFGSDAGTATAAVFVAHAIYTYSTNGWNWDNTGTRIVTVGTTNSQTVSITWNGTYLIVAYRDGGWNVSCTYTTTRNGSGGWVAAFTLDTGSGSHFNPILLHDPLIAGGAGATVLIYPLDSVAGHSDTLNCRVLLDTAASPASANWQAHVAAAETAQNFGAAQLAATVDPRTGTIHVLTGTSVATVGVYYNKLTVNSSGTATWTARNLVDGATGGIYTLSIHVDGQSRLYAFIQAGTVGSVGTVGFRTSDPPYTSWSTLNSTVASTTGDCLPQVPKHDSLSNLGFIPFLFQRGSASAQYDNTIVAQIPPIISNPASISRGNIFTRRDLLPFQSGQRHASPASVQPTPLALSGTINGGGFAALNIPIGLVVSTQTQTGISGGPPGNNTTETDITWVDFNGNGRRVGIIPAYGGADISATYEIVNSIVANAISQTSLSTSVPDGFIHVLANNGTFTGSEDPTFTLSELGFGSLERRMYDSGTITPSSGPALNYRVRIAIYPGDPMLIFTQIDITNPSGSAVALNGADGIEIALIGGRTTVNQGAGATDAWPGTNGLYATSIGGTETAWPGDTSPGPQAADPIYVYITPTTNTGLSDVPFNVKILGLGPDISLGTTPKISFLGPPDAASSRVKVKVQVTLASFPASTTKSPQYVQGFKRSPAAGDINSIAADLRNPDASSIVSQGTPASPFFDQLNGWYDVAAVGNGVLLTHTIPSGGTARWLPAYRVTNWTDTSGTVPVSLSGVALKYPFDYLFAVDTVNHIAYVKIMKPLVASGASSSQLNNGPLLIGTALMGVAQAPTALSGTLTETLALSGTISGGGVLSATAAIAEALSGTVAGASVETGTLSVAEALAGTLAGTSADAGTLTEAVALAGTVVGASSETGTLINVAVLAGSTGGIATQTGTLLEAVALNGQVTGASVETGTLTEAVAVSGTSVGASAWSGNLQVVSGTPLAGTIVGASAESATLLEAVALSGSSTGASANSGALSEGVAVAGSSVGSSAWSGNLQLLTGTQISGVVGGTSSFSGTLSMAVAMSGSSQAPSALGATLAIAAAIAGSSGSPAVLSATLQLLSGTAIAGTSRGATQFSGTLLLSTGLSGSVGGAASLAAGLALRQQLRGTVIGTSTWICVNAVAKPVFILVEAHSRDGKAPASARDGKFNARSRDGKFRAGVS